MTGPRGRPFTVEHFDRWARRIVLDNGRHWMVEDFQAAFLDDVFAGGSAFHWTFPEAWLVIPEGNAKTTLVAGLALYHLEFTTSANVPAAASSREQAEILYLQAEGMVIRSEMGGFKCLPGFRRIRFDAMGSRLQIFAADDRTGDGVVPTLALVDELHRHRDLALYRTWRGKLDKRGGQIVTISTAGEPGAEFETQREMIRQGAADITRTETYVRAASDELVLHEYAVPEDGDTDDLELVKRANPLKAVTLAQLARKKASPTMTPAHWRRFTCNLPTRSEAAAITESEWFGAAVAETIPEGQSVWAGLDVAWKWDTTALVPVWIRDAEYRLLGPADVLVPPRDGTSLEPSLVEDTLRRLHARNPIHTLIMDETRAEQLAAWAEDTLGCRVQPWPHSPKMAALDYERFMEALREGWLHHTGDPKLTRHVLNAVARMRAEGTRFDRPSQTREGGNQDMRVIDALVAAAMVHNAAAAEIGIAREPMMAWA
jgi:phage terminase large subunit-like protein